MQQSDDGQLAGYWQNIAEKIQADGSEDQVDDLVDVLARYLICNPPDPAASDILCLALTKARSSLSKRSAALALAYVAEPTSIKAVDALTEFYRQCADRHFLAPQILAAITLFATRSALARAEAARKQGVRVGL